MQNVYESVDANKLKSWLIMGGFVAFVTLAAYLISQSLGLYYGHETSGFGIAGVALVISGITSFISYYFSDRIILGISSARPADKRTHYQFYTVTENLCLAAGIPVPRLYVIDDTAPNAFATGRDPGHAVVCVTTGLISKLNRTELEGVIGHELSHIANYDIRLMSVVTVLVGLITLLGDWLLRANFYSTGSRSRENERGNSAALFFVLGILFAIISPLVAKLIQLAISRRREFLADANSVKITRQPSGLISALRKLGSDREPLEVANKATAHLYIVNPLKNHHDAIGQFAHLFNTHPSLHDRISQLEQMT